MPPGVTVLLPPVPPTSILAEVVPYSMTPASESFSVVPAGHEPETMGRITPDGKLYVAALTSICCWDWPNNATQSRIRNINLSEILILC